MRQTMWRTPHEPIRRETSRDRGRPSAAFSPTSPVMTRLRFTLRRAVLSAAATVALSAPALAQPGTVTFTPTGNGGAVTPVYAGPALTYSGTVRSTFGSAASVGADLLYWSGAYSGGPAVYGNSSATGHVAEFALTGTAGTLLTFDAASFGGYSNAARTLRVRIYDAGFTQLFDQLLAVPSSPQAVLNFGGVNTLSGTLRLQFTEVDANGVAAGRGPFDVGFSSLDYAVGGQAVVPEPSTYVLLAGGLAGVAAVARRRARAASAA